MASSVSPGSKATSTTVSASGTIPTAVSEVEETIARIRSHKGVEGVLIMTQEGKMSPYCRLLLVFIIYFNGLYISFLFLFVKFISLIPFVF